MFTSRATDGGSIVFSWQDLFLTGSHTWRAEFSERVCYRRARECSLPFLSCLLPSAPFARITFTRSVGRRSRTCFPARLSREGLLAVYSSIGFHLRHSQALVKRVKYKLTTLSVHLLYKQDKNKTWLNKQTVALLAPLNSIELNLLKSSSTLTSIFST